MAQPHQSIRKLGLLTCCLKPLPGPPKRMSRSSGAQSSRCVLDWPDVVSQDKADQAGGVAELGVPGPGAGVAYPGLDLTVGPYCAAHRLWGGEESYRVCGPWAVCVVLDLQLDCFFGRDQLVLEPTGAPAVDGAIPDAVLPLDCVVRPHREPSEHAATITHTRTRVLCRL